MKRIIEVPLVRIFMASGLVLISTNTIEEINDLIEEAKSLDKETVQLDNDGLRLILQISKIQGLEGK